MLKKTAMFLFGCCLVSIVSTIPHNPLTHADTVVLNNDRVLTGTIIEVTENTVRLRLSAGTEIEIQRDMVLSLEYDENNTGPGNLDGNAQELLQQGAALEKKGRFDDALDCYLAAWKKDPDNNTIGKKIEQVRLARLVYIISHPEEVANKGIDELQRAGEKAVPIIEASLEEELERFQRWLEEDSLKKLQASLLTELNKRRKRAISFIMNKSKYDKTEAMVMGQEHVNELMRLVRILYENAGDRSFLEQNSGFRKNASALDVLIRAYRNCKGPKKKQKEYQEKIDTVYELLKKKLDFRTMDLENKEYRETISFNDQVTMNPKCKELAHRINNYRMRMGLRPLRIHEALNLSSQRHSDEMDKLNYFDHISPIDKHDKPQKRITKAGYRYNKRSTNSPTGEVLTQGPHTADEALVTWQESPGHHRCLLRKHWIHIGVGLKADLWTVNVAVPEKK